jgi:hypothetical protein
MACTLVHLTLQLLVSDNFNEPEPVIICCICQFALSGSIKLLVDYVVDKHQYSKNLARELS